VVIQVTVLKYNCIFSKNVDYWPMAIYCSVLNTISVTSKFKTMKTMNLLKCLQYNYLKNGYFCLKNLTRDRVEGVYFTPKLFFLLFINGKLVCFANNGNFCLKIIIISQQQL